MSCCMLMVVACIPLMRVDAPHTSDFVKNIGFTIVENNLSKHLENDLLAMPGHTSFSTGASA